MASFGGPSGIDERKIEEIVSRVLERLGEVVSVHVIPRPHANVDAVLPLGRGGGVPDGRAPDSTKK